MKPESLVVAQEQAEGGIWTITLDSPGNRNALSTTLVKQLAEAAERATLSRAKAIFLRSSGPAFCSGADLVEPRSGAVDEALQLVAESPIPWVACVEGPAVGAGAALAGLCMIGILTTDAWFMLPEIDRLGRFPVGVSRWLAGAVDMRGIVQGALQGKPIDADRAARMGWGTVVSSGNDFAECSRQWAERLATVPYEAMADAQRRWAQYLRMHRSPLSGRTPEGPLPTSVGNGEREVSTS